jgi:ATP-binding cassette subfamily B protein
MSEKQKSNEQSKAYKRPLHVPQGHGPHGHGRGEKPKNFKRAMKQTISYVMAKHALPIVLVIIFAIASVILNIQGPKISGSAITELFNGLLAKLGGTGGINYSKIATILLIMMAVYMGSALLGFVQHWIMASVAQRIGYDMRRSIVEKIGRMPMKYFESRTTGEVLSRITNDVDIMQQNLYQSVNQMITSVVTVIGVVVMMLTISPLMTLITVLILPVALVLITLVMGRSQKYFRDQQNKLSDVNGEVEEMIGGQQVVKLFNYEAEARKSFNKLNQQLYTSAWKSQFLGGLMGPLMNMVANLGFVGISILGGVFAFQGRITVGDIQAFTSYVRNFTMPLNQLAQVTNMLQSMAAGAERVFEFLDEAEEAQTVENPVQLPGPAQGRVDFENVHFGYNPDKIVIQNFNAHVKPGQTIAIVGPTGAGKTTMVKLLMRFYDVNSGDIKLDGHDVRTYNRSDLRKNIGMVLQDTWLFEGTIMENIRYGRLDATDEEVIKASMSAYAHRFIQSLPGGYNMVLNEDATNISAGQKQLLTIARAILANKPVLILDEATSSVDTRTEQLIQNAMNNLMQGRTSFVIAHRLSTIRDADLILAMNNGDIVEQGTHQELLAKGGFYAELYNSQFETAD